MKTLSDGLAHECIVDRGFCLGSFRPKYNWRMLRHYQNIRNEIIDTIRGLVSNVREFARMFGFEPHNTTSELV